MNLRANEHSWSDHLTMSAGYLKCELLSSFCHKETMQWRDVEIEIPLKIFTFSSNLSI